MDSESLLQTLVRRTYYFRGKLIGFLIVKNKIFELIFSKKFPF